MKWFKFQFDMFGIRWDDFGWWIVFKLPRRFIYRCIIRGWAEASERYPTTVLKDINVEQVLEAIMQRPRSYSPNLFGLEIFEEDIKR